MNVDVVADWLNRGGHDQYRYFTLGFGNSISKLAVLTDASSVDGEWYTGRLLPELTRYGGASLTQAKYFGTAGLDSLRAIMMHADKYGLKWIFSNDPYYDPLLSFAGWRPVDYLDNKTITVWTKDGVPPATPVNVAQRTPHWQGVMWGTISVWKQHLGHSCLPRPRKKTAGDRCRIFLRRRRSKRSEDGVVKKGGLLALSLAVATVLLIVIGCVWPVAAARPFIIQKSLLTSSSTPEEAVQNLGQEIEAHDWQKAYESFANKAQFTEQEFELDLTGYTTNLRTYSHAGSLQCVAAPRIG